MTPEMMIRLVLTALVDGELDGHPLVRRVRRHRLTTRVVLVATLALSCTHAVPPPPQDEEPATWVADVQDAGVVARPMPATPFKGQKRAPCVPVAQVEIEGRCWAPLAYTAEQVPGCGADAYEHQGRCYLPVRQAEPRPTSVQP